MGRRSSGGLKPKKRKKVTVTLIKERQNGEATEPYKILNEIRRKEHNHLSEAKIALAWRHGWRADADGRMILGQCRKRGDLDRELDGFDFIILLNKEAWERLNEKQRRALVDHELCHAQLVIDADGSPKLNDRDRLVTRTKKHNCEEFREVVDRHGLWKQDLEAFAQAAINDAKRPLLPTDGTATSSTAKAEPAASGNGNGKGKPETHVPGAWRSWKTMILDAYGLPGGKVKLLESAGLDTLGKLVDSIKRADEPGFWYRNIKGFGEGGYEALTDAIMALRKARPEFQADEK